MVPILEERGVLIKMLRSLISCVVVRFRGNVGCKVDSKNSCDGPLSQSSLYRKAVGSALRGSTQSHHDRLCLLRSPRLGVRDAPQAARPRAVYPLLAPCRPLACS